MKEDSRNVLGGVLEPCSKRPMTGYWRNGCCVTGAADTGRHTVCAIMTAEFLAFASEVIEELPRGNSERADQLIRAAEAVPRNIAEGAGRQIDCDRRAPRRHRIRQG